MKGKSAKADWKPALAGFSHLGRVNGLLRRRPEWATPGLAPRAKRVASSRVRPEARARSRQATLAQAIARTKTTAPSMVMISRRISSGM